MKGSNNSNRAQRPSPARELREGVWEKPTTKPPVATSAPVPPPPKVTKK